MPIDGPSTLCRRGARAVTEEPPTAAALVDLAGRRGAQISSSPEPRPAVDRDRDTAARLPDEPAAEGLEARRFPGAAGAVRLVAGCWARAASARGGGAGSSARQAAVQARALAAFAAAGRPRCWTAPRPRWVPRRPRRGPPGRRR